MFAASRILGAGTQCLLIVEYEEEERSVCCQYNAWSRKEGCCH